MTGQNPGAGKAPQAPAPTVEDDVPDPDEDDLDDLDDMLDDFSTMNVQLPKPGPSTAAPAPAPASVPPSAAKGAGTSAGTGAAAGTGTDDDQDLEALLGDDEFAKELAKNMASLFGGTDMEEQLKSFMEEYAGGGDGPSASSAGASSARSAPAPGAAPSAAPSASASATEGSAPGFQNRINETIRRLQESNRQATEATSTPSKDPDDFMAAMLQQLSEGAVGGAAGMGSEDDFSKLLVGMMEELTHKEILYEPMKELDDRFPKWLEENKSKVSADDLKRYEAQRAVVRDIVARYDQKDYSDSNAADRDYIVERMQKMQEAGAPPPDLVGDMSSASEMLEMGEGCNPQ